MPAEDWRRVQLQMNRGTFVAAAVEAARDESGRRLVLDELKQLLVDLMDLLEQTDEEAPIIIAHRALLDAMRALPSCTCEEFGRHEDQRALALLGLGGTTLNDAEETDHG